MPLGRAERVCGTRTNGPTLFEHEAFMDPDEQNKERRIQAVAAQYPGQRVVVIETDNWKGMMATQIFHMRNRGTLPDPRYTYHVDIKGDI
jgi:hypothetical protein